MKNAFHFTLKALFVLEMFNFLSWLFGLDEIQLDYKDNINFKIYDVTTYESIAIHMLNNISRITGNQTRKFGQLIEYNMRNNFLEKSYTKYGWEIIPKPFFRKVKIWHICVDSLKFYAVCFYCMPSWWLSKHIEAKLQTTWFYFE